MRDKKFDGAKYSSDALRMLRRRQFAAGFSFQSHRRMELKEPHVFVDNIVRSCFCARAC